jgi:hypothetical protein
MKWRLPDFPTRPSDLPTELPGLKCAAGLAAAGFLVFHIRVNRDWSRWSCSVLRMLCKMVRGYDFPYLAEGTPDILLFNIQPKIYPWQRHCAADAGGLVAVR